MTGTEMILAGLGASHVVAAGLGWFAGHHGVAATVKAVANIPATVQADVNTLKTDVSNLKTKVGL